ncbi:MAG TPA: GNAT family N-acetyltransferase [Kamptonema sp.]|nr:GNAT family N-acetyltransferase [Kamptonema sp.]
MNSTFYETKRLILRPFTRTDYHPLLPIYSQPLEMRYIGKGALTPDKIWKYVNDAIAHWEKYNCGPMVVIDKASGEVIGRGGHYYSDRTPYLQHGYVLKHKFWGKGLGTEVAKANLDIAFQQLNQPVLVAYAMPENQASRHILNKIGMEYQGIISYAQTQYAYYSLSRAQYFANLALADKAA